MTALPVTTGVVARLYDAVTRPTDTPGSTRVGVVIPHNDAAELLDRVARECPDHHVCGGCGAHGCLRCGIDAAGGPWCSEHGDELCAACRSECPRCRSAARQEVNGL